MRMMRHRLMLGGLGLVGILLSVGCVGPEYQAPEEVTAMIPQIDLERPAAVETATFALG